MTWDDWTARALDALDAANHRRRLAPIAPAGSAVEVTRDGRSLVLFSGNDYLGLSTHPRVRRAAARAAAASMGPRGSALICGHTEAHDALARALADLLGAEAALLFPSGFAANLATLGALAGPDLTIVSDALNHASLIDGCRLARRGGAEVVVVPHRDVAAVRAAVDASDRPRKLVVTDALFSMDGTRAPLDELVALRRGRDDVRLMLDEAHALLVLGPRGGGLADERGLTDAVDLRVATLSKAAAAQGGVLVADAGLRDLVLNRGRAFVFSTAIPLPVVAAAREALRVAADEPGLRQRLWRHVRRVGDALGIDAPTPIVPILLGDEGRALAEAERLLAAGLHVVAVRPPTVPPGSSRLRVALSAAHTDGHIGRLLDALVG